MGRPPLAATVSEAKGSPPNCGSVSGTRVPKLHSFMDREGWEEKQTRKKEHHRRCISAWKTTGTQRLLEVWALQTGCVEGTMAPEGEDVEWLGVDTFLSYPTLSLTVGTSALVLRTRKSNKAENYRAYIFC